MSMGTRWGWRTDMSGKCDKCGGDIGAVSVTLRHVSFTGNLISKTESEMSVHPTCRDEMKASDSWHW